VTQYIYRHPEAFRIAHLTQTPDLGALRWTVDTPADFEMVEKVITGLAGRTIFSSRKCSISWKITRDHRDQHAVTRHNWKGAGPRS